MNPATHMGALGGQHMFEFLQAAAPFVVVLFALVGLIMFGMGLYSLYRVANGQAREETAGTGIREIIAGTILVSLIYWLGVSGNTLTGSTGMPNAVWNSPAPTTGPNAGQSAWRTLAMAWIQFLGIIFYGMGWVEAGRIGKRQDATIAGAVWRVVAGTLMFNVAIVGRWASWLFGFIA